MPKKCRATIIGGGLVGSLCACFLAKRGYQVDLYEKREDLRKGTTQGNALTLGLSHRGRKALRLVGLEEEVLKHAVPLKGRFCHFMSGKQKFIPYDINDECIYSIARNCLNGIILTALDQCSNVKLHFKHELMGIDLNKQIFAVKNVESQEVLEMEYDFLIGADGAYSFVRREMQRSTLFSFSQKYMEHGYVELIVNPINGKKMKPNCLHVWPRGSFMMVAFPNIDGTWSVSLFMPFDNFRPLTNSSDVLNFFRKFFPDSIELLGEEQLICNFLKLKPRSLIYVFCDPLHDGDGTLLIGDAAHAMVPFYAQGMNSGFEDCRVLNEVLQDNGDDVATSIREFTRIRKDDVHAICELSIFNYKEMRDLVRQGSYNARKLVDNLLYRLFPNLWVPLYTSVAFSDINYRKCLEHRKWQDNVLWFASILLVAVVILSLMILFVF